MATSLENFKAAVQTLWEALPPPEDDGSGLGYRFIDDLTEERGNGRHRELIWRGATDLNLLLEPAVQTSWTLACEFFVARNPGGSARTYAAWKTAVEFEVMALIKSYLLLANLGTNVLEGVLTNVKIPEELPQRTTSGMGAGLPQDVVVRARFTFQVETQEG